MRIGENGVDFRVIRVELDGRLHLGKSAVPIAGREQPIGIVGAHRRIFRLCRGCPFEVLRALDVTFGGQVGHARDREQLWIRSGSRHRRLQQIRGEFRPIPMQQRGRQQLAGINHVGPELNEAPQMFIGLLICTD